MRGFTREAKNKLLKYEWPGNVRELQHVVERAVIMGDGGLLHPAELPLRPAPTSDPRIGEDFNLEMVEKKTRLSVPSACMAAI